MEDTRKNEPAASRRRSRVAQDPISAGLRALWAALENDPVPDEFLSLLDKIDSAAAEKSAEERDA